MGSVPTAAGDPIFWLHHCNIDRLWESWNRVPNRTNPAWPARAFPFADGKGAAVSVLPAAANRTSLIKYQYDSSATPPGGVGQSAPNNTNVRGQSHSRVTTPY